MRPLIKRLSLVAFIAFADLAMAEQNIVHFKDKQIDMKADNLKQLNTFVAAHSGVKFSITANKYDANDASVRGMPRKYSLMRALKIRKLLLQKGVQLSNIQVMVTTDISKENDLVTIDVK